MGGSIKKNLFVGRDYDVHWMVVIVGLLADLLKLIECLLVPLSPRRSGLRVLIPTAPRVSEAVPQSAGLHEADPVAQVPGGLCPGKSH